MTLKCLSYAFFHVDGAEKYGLLMNCLRRCVHLTGSIFLYLHMTVGSTNIESKVSFMERNGH